MRLGYLEMIYRFGFMIQSILIHSLFVSGSFICNGQGLAYKKPMEAVGSALVS